MLIALLIGFQVKSIGESEKHLSPEIREISLCDVWLKTAELMIKNVSELRDKNPFDIATKYNIINQHKDEDKDSVQ